MPTILYADFFIVKVSIVSISLKNIIIVSFQGKFFFCTDQSKMTKEECQ